MENIMKRVLVIGSNSFSGSDFIDLLLEDKKYEVHAISRSPEKSALFLPYKKNQKHCQFKQINLNTDLDTLQTLLNEFQPTHIVNFAAQSEVAPSWDHPHHWYQTNVVALTKFINLIKDSKVLEKYVHISSPEVYGTCSDNITEDAPLNPTTPYAASKAAGDLSLLTFFKNFSFPLVMVRPTNVYGAHQQLFKIIPRSAIYIKNKINIPLHGGGQAIKSYIHIRDISRGVKSAMELGTPGAIYHLSPDQGVSIQQVVQSICHYLDVDIDHVTTKVAERLGQDRAYIIDSTKARQEFNWKPTISLDEGIRDTISWVENNFSDINNEPLEYIHKE